MTAYYRPKTLDQGLSILASEPVSIIAGATDVYPARVSERTWQHNQARRWLDITGINELCRITETDTEFRIGALVTWSELRDAKLPRQFDALREAAAQVGGLQIQNRATLVGNLCNASPAADGVPPLLCLDACVELARKGQQRRVALADFILGNRQTDLAAREMVTAIVVPKMATHQRYHSGFYKLGARKYLVISIVMAAALVAVDDERLITRCHLAVGSCSAVAQRLTDLEVDLTGQPLDSGISELVCAHHLQHLQPISDVRADAEYRQRAAGEVVAQLLLQLGRNLDNQA